MADDEYAVSDAWSAHKDFKKPFDYILENSGQKLLLHRLDMPDLLKLGVAGELDFMSRALMSNPQADDAKAQAAVAEAVSSSGDNFAKVEVMINKVVMAGVIKPQIHDDPPQEQAKQPGLFYVSYIPWEDRMELFSVIFDSGGLSDFREEQEPGVGDMADVQIVQLPADGPVADVRSSESEGVLSQ